MEKVESKIGYVVKKKMGAEQVRQIKIQATLFFNPNHWFTDQQSWSTWY